MTDTNKSDTLNDNNKVPNYVIISLARLLLPYIQSYYNSERNSTTVISDSKNKVS